MLKEVSTQFGISVRTKDALDKFKAQNKDVILAKLKKKRRLVTNGDVIDYLLLQVKK
jgi:hypothetical protein